MKKIFIYFVLGFIPINFLFSNPIVIPQAFISELKFEGTAIWFLEISFNQNQPYTKNQYDSICIGTSNGFSRIVLDNIEDKATLFVVTSDSLMSPLSINKEGDCIKLYSFLSTNYSYHDPEIDSLKFGNYSGSLIDSLQTGYSIASVFYHQFCKDKSPTIGLPNDTAGTCGTLYGHIYNKNNKLVIEGNFQIENLIIFLNDSTYRTQIFSRRVNFNGMLNHYKPSYSQGVQIDSLKLNINPDSSYNKDIHILSDYIVGIKEMKDETEDELSILNYPNPFNSSTNFAVNIPLRLQGKEMQINIYNSIGQRIAFLSIHKSSQVTWGGRDLKGSLVSSGRYYYQLAHGNKVYKNGSLILLK